MAPATYVSPSMAPTTATTPRCINAKFAVSRAFAQSSQHGSGHDHNSVRRKARSMAPTTATTRSMAPTAATTPCRINAEFAGSREFALSSQHGFDHDHNSVRRKARGMAPITTTVPHRRAAELRHRDTGGARKAATMGVTTARTAARQERVTTARTAARQEGERVGRH